MKERNLNDSKDACLVVDPILSDAPSWLKLDTAGGTFFSPVVEIAFEVSPGNGLGLGADFGGAI